jgi:glycosyltransferase involved in cell wall biosynthesis
MILTTGRRNIGTTAIHLYTTGDCRDINTWSNLPYYFFRYLQARSVAVRPFDLVPSQERRYRTFSRFIAARAAALRFVRPGYRHDMLRSRTYHRLVNQRIRSLAQRHPDSDLNLFFTFSFSSHRFARTPVVLYCDRTYEHHLEETGRPPTRNDRHFIRIDRRNIEEADLVLTTDPLCCDFIKTRYEPKRAFCLRPGISTDVCVNDAAPLIASKEHSLDVLFIGSGAYRRGVDILIRAFKMFNDQHDRRFTLHIVGVQSNELPEELRVADPRIQFYKYLDRSIPGDLAQYNNLLRSAKLFVMPMRPGPFPGVISEVQLHGTPVIVSRVSATPAFLTHGQDSVLVESLEPRAFASEMDRLVRDAPTWRQLAWNGHIANRNLTWLNTVDTFLRIVRENNLVSRDRFTDRRDDHEAADNLTESYASSRG